LAYENLQEPQVVTLNISTVNVVVAVSHGIIVVGLAASRFGYRRAVKQTWFGSELRRNVNQKIDLPFLFLCAALP
jgi:hypothetical protein